MELFHPLKNTVDAMAVDVLHSTADELTVEYQGKTYQLGWHNQYSYYYGKVKDHLGFIL